MRQSRQRSLLAAGPSPGLGAAAPAPARIGTGRRSRADAAQGCRRAAADVRGTCGSRRGGGGRGAEASCRSRRGMYLSIHPPNYERRRRKKKKKKNPTITRWRREDLDGGDEKRIPIPTYLLTYLLTYILTAGGQWPNRQERKPSRRGSSARSWPRRRSRRATIR